MSKLNVRIMAAVPNVSTDDAIRVKDELQNALIGVLSRFEGATINSHISVEENANIEDLSGDDHTRLVS